MSKQIGEIFTDLNKTKNNAEKIKILRANDSKILRELLRVNFDKNFQFSLPEGAPPYKKSTEPVGMGYTTLLNEWKRMYLFVKDKSPDVKSLKREMLFISLLESLDSVESEILLQIKDKKLKGITLKQVQEAYPDFMRNINEVKTDN